MTATTAILMIDVQKTYLDQARRDALGWPPIWRLAEVVGQCRQLLTAPGAAWDRAFTTPHYGRRIPPP